MYERDRHCKECCFTSSWCQLVEVENRVARALCMCAVKKNVMYTLQWHLHLIAWRHAYSHRIAQRTPGPLRLLLPLAASVLKWTCHAQNAPKSLPHLLESPAAPCCPAPPRCSAARHVLQQTLCKQGDSRCQQLLCLSPAILLIYALRDKDALDCWHRAHVCSRHRGAGLCRVDVKRALHMQPPHK